MSEKGTVLVVGDAGFVAMRCIIRLMEEGYQVRATVGSKATGEFVREVLSRLGGTESLEMCVVDLSSDESWSDAVRGCRFVMHVATPLPGESLENEFEPIAPGREEALRLLRVAWHPPLTKNP